MIGSFAPGSFFSMVCTSEYLHLSINRGWHDYDRFSGATQSAHGLTRAMALRQRRGIGPRAAIAAAPPLMRWLLLLRP
jgi:hypothetical protein